MLTRPQFLEGSAVEQLEALRTAVREGVPSVMMTADPRHDDGLQDPEAAIAEALEAGGDGARPTRLIGPAAGGWVVGDGAVALLAAVGADFRALVGAVGPLRRGIDLGLAWDVTPAEALAWLARDPAVRAIGLAGVPGARHADGAFAATLCEVVARMPVMALGPASDAAAWAVFGVQSIDDSAALGRELVVGKRFALFASELRAAVGPLRAGVDRFETATLPGLERAQALLAAALLMRRTALGRHATLELLGALGAGRKAPTLVVASVAAARDAAARLGYPVVLGTDEGALGAARADGPDAVAAAWDALETNLAAVGGEARYAPRYVAAFPAGAREVRVELGQSVVGPVAIWDGVAAPAVASAASNGLARAIAALAEHLPELTALELRAAETPAGLVLVDARARLASVLDVPQPGRYSPAV